MAKAKGKAQKRGVAEPVRRGIALGSTALTVAETIESYPVLEGFRISVNGLDIDGKPSIEDWQRAGDTLRTAERGIQFALGDFINEIETRLGEEAAQILDYSSGWSEKTCSVYRWLAGRIPREIRRMDRLGVAHHLAVASLSRAQQEKWLTKAADDDEEKPWTVARLAKALKAGGDLPPSAFWVLALASSAEDQSQLMQSLEQQGRTVKAVTRRGLPPARAEAS